MWKCAYVCDYEIGKTIINICSWKSALNSDIFKIVFIFRNQFEFSYLHILFLNFSFRHFLQVVSFRVSLDTPDLLRYVVSVSKSYLKGAGVKRPQFTPADFEKNQVQSFSTHKFPQYGKSFWCNIQTQFVSII